MHSRKTASRLGTVATAAMVMLAGCTNDATDTTEEPSPGSTASPTIETAGTTVSASFALLEGRPEGYDGLSGTATLSIANEATGGTISLTGLKPETAYVAHVHQQGCDMEKGGPHFKFDPAGSDMPPNEIHWKFTSDAEGSAEVTATNEQAVPQPADRSIVVHEDPGAGSGGTNGMNSEEMEGDMAESAHSHQPKIACADLS